MVAAALRLHVSAGGSRVPLPVDLVDLEEVQERNHAAVGSGAPQRPQTVHQRRRSHVAALYCQCCYMCIPSAFVHLSVQLDGHCAARCSGSCRAVQPACLLLLTPRHLLQIYGKHDDTQCATATSETLLAHGTPHPSSATIGYSFEWQM